MSGNGRPNSAGGWSKEAVIGVVALVVMILLPCLGVFWKNVRVRGFCRRWWNRVRGRAPFARLDVEMGPLLQNHGADRIPIIVDALVLETLREQQAWASARKEHAACEQRVMSGHEANTESKAQLDIRLILPLAGIESSSERSSIAGSWSFDPHTARTREQ
ncbi:hypothetical protein AOQ84DRAFT_439228 [Glonium stellatum]|uniref:Uncharacterized protein n=1 Tax=Glonium stellatum TaxID=574774 RepID=A0A8E2F2D6_9PEZI|nr:hypothetical protein AOQ84DRAFT_439228 [Glonium stellatum]